MLTDNLLMDFFSRRWLDLTFSLFCKNNTEVRKLLQNKESYTTIEKSARPTCIERALKYRKLGKIEFRNSRINSEFSNIPSTMLLAILILYSHEDYLSSMRTVKQYENDIGDLLDVYFAEIDIATIRIRRSLRYRLESGYRSYSPIIDISVGPFSERKGVSLWGDYDRLVHFSCDLIGDMLEQFRCNYQDFGEGFFEIEERTLPSGYEDLLSTSEHALENVNWNARCFMAIEVEESGSRKHLLGDMINVSISGRIGVVIGYNRDKYETFLKQLDYLAYTVKAGKIRFNSRNIIVLKPDQFESILINNLRETY